MTVDSELADRVILVHTELVTRKQWTSSLNRGEQCRNDVSFVSNGAMLSLYIILLPFPSGKYDDTRNAL